MPDRSWLFWCCCSCRAVSAEGHHFGHYGSQNKDSFLVKALIARIPAYRIGLASSHAWEAFEWNISRWDGSWWVLWLIHIAMCIMRILYCNRENYPNNCFAGSSCLWRRQLGPSLDCCAYIGHAQLGVWTKEMVSCLQTSHILWFFQGKKAEENCMLTNIYQQPLATCIFLHWTYRVGQNGTLSMCVSPPTILQLQTIGLSSRWSGNI